METKLLNMFVQNYIFNILFTSLDPNYLKNIKRTSNS